MLIGYKRGATSITFWVKILDTSTSQGKTGLTFSSSGLIISTLASNEASATAYTQAGSTIETIATLGTYAAPTTNKCRFKEVDATNHKGIYEVQLANARFAVASAKNLLVSLSGVSGMAEADLVIPLRDLDPYDAVRGGLTALPNQAAEAAGGLYTRGTGAGQVNQAANGQIDVKIVSAAADVVNASALAADAVTEIQTGLASAASIAGLNNLSAGQVNAEIVDALATDTYAEMTGTPAATISLANKINWLYMALRNKFEVNSTAKTFYDDSGSAVWKKTLADNGTTYSETEATSP